jgi:hypothetical protein
MDRRFMEGLSWAEWAVSRWDGFRVRAQPRPLVLVGPEVFVERGFGSGEAKLAYLEGRFEALTSIPDSVLVALRAIGRSGSGRSDLEPLWITHASRCEAEFRTDRGRARLPAWRLTVSCTLGPIWVLDPEVQPPQWRPSDPPSRPRPQSQPPVGDPGARAVLGDDERTLTLEFLGALPEYERYIGAEVIESPAAVAIVPAGEDIGPAGARLLPGHVHQVTVRLNQPLGARVCVDLHGNAVEVCATETSANGR